MSSQRFAPLPRALSCWETKNNIKKIKCNFLDAKTQDLKGCLVDGINKLRLAGMYLRANVFFVRSLQVRQVREEAGRGICCVAILQGQHRGLSVADHALRLLRQIVLGFRDDKAAAGQCVDVTLDFECHECMTYIKHLNKAPLIDPAQ